MQSWNKAYETKPKVYFKYSIYFHVLFESKMAMRVLEFDYLFYWKLTK